MIVKGFNRTTIECWYKKMRQNTCKCETNWDSQNSDLPTKLSNCWSQSKRRNCEWEVDWCLIRWWRDPASEPSALSRGQYECKEKSTFCLLVFFIIIHIYLFNFLVPVGMLWKAQKLTVLRPPLKIVVDFVVHFDVQYVKTKWYQSTSHLLYG